MAIIRIIHMPARRTATMARATSSVACSSAPAPGTTSTIAATGLAITGAATTAGDTAGDTAMDTTEAGVTDIEAAMTMGSAVEIEAGITTATDTAAEITAEASAADMAGDTTVAAVTTVAEATDVVNTRLKVLLP